LVSAKNNDGELEILLAVGEQIKQRRRCIEQKNQPWPTAEGEQRGEERLRRRARRWCGRAAAAREAMAEEQQRGKLRRASEWGAGRSEEESGDGAEESGDGRSAGCVGILSRDFLQNSPCVIYFAPEGVIKENALYETTDLKLKLLEFCIKNMCGREMMCNFLDMSASAPVLSPVTPSIPSPSPLPTP
jgi:hypothetical protein